MMPVSRSRWRPRRVARESAAFDLHAAVQRGASPPEQCGSQLDALVERGRIDDQQAEAGVAEAGKRDGDG